MLNKKILLNQYSFQYNSIIKNYTLKELDKIYILNYIQCIYFVNENNYFKNRLVLFEEKTEN